jgi:hypothetical protein
MLFFTNFRQIRIFAKTFQRKLFAKTFREKETKFRENRETFRKSFRFREK